MRCFFQLCVLLLVLLSTGTHAWGKVDVSEKIASGGPAAILVDITDPDAPPTLLLPGEPGPDGYELASDVRDGPNLYAYVQQNPWSKFDAEGMFWSAIITAGFAAYDTYKWAKGDMSNADYAAAMALNGAALLADVATAGNGGGLAVRAANAAIKVAKVVDKANTVVETAQAAVDTTETIVSAVQEGDGRGVMRTVGGALLDAATDKVLGKKVKANVDVPTDPTKRRVPLRKQTLEDIKADQPRNEHGEMIDPNTKEPLREGEIDVGHKTGEEWRTRKKMHQERGSTRKEVIEAENDPKIYHLEDRSSNRGHAHEKKD